MLQEEGADGEVGGDVEGRSPSVVPCVDIGTVLYQQSDDIRVSARSRPVQRGPADGAPCVDVGPMLQQQLDEIRATIPCRPGQLPLGLAIKVHRRVPAAGADQQVAVDDLWDAIARGIETFTPTECQNYFAAAGYDRD